MKVDQVLVSSNMFVYCENNPIVQHDTDGRDDELAIQDNTQALYDLLDTYAIISETGFSIDLETATDEWNECLTQIGIDESYVYMSEYLRAKYYEVYQKEFSFSESSVAYEIQYHVDAYMWTQGYKGYSRNITTYLLTASALEEHCKTVDISTKDSDSFIQRIMFGYNKGTRNRNKSGKKTPHYGNKHGKAMRNKSKKEYQIK